MHSQNETDNSVEIHLVKCAISTLIMEIKFMETFIYVKLVENINTEFR